MRLREPHVSIGLLAFTLVVHGHLLLNDGVYWDGWLLYGYYLNDDAASLFTMFREAGGPLTSYLHWFFWFSPLGLIATYKLAVWLAIASATILVFKILQRTAVFSSREALFAAMLVNCYTAYRVNVELIMMPTAIAYALQLFGVTLFLAAIDRSGIGRAALLAGVLVTLGLAALAPPFVVLHAALVPFLVYEGWFRKPAKRLNSLAILVVAAVPILVYLGKANFAPPSGLYADYNVAEVPTLSGAIAFSSEFLRITIVEQFAEAFARLADHPILTLLIAVAAVWFAWRLQKEKSVPPSASSRWAIPAVAVYALVLLVTAIFPYLAVDKMATLNGWDSRHGVLMALPVVLGLVLVAKILVRMFGPLARIGLATVATVLILGFVLSSWQIYTLWQLRAIKDRSIIANIGDAPDDLLDRSSYIFVDDTSLVFGQKYYFYEYNGMLRVGRDRERWIANTANENTDLPRLASQMPPARYLFDDFEPNGCSAALAVRSPFLAEPGWRTVLAYNYLSLIDDKALKEWLRSQTELVWTDLSQQRIDDLKAISTALEAYRGDNGAYPAPEGESASYGSEGGDRTDWIPGLAPNYIAALPTDPRMVTAENKQYIYISNGTDYKIIAHAPEDAECVRRLRPDLADPVRDAYAYGFWSKGAAGF